MLRRKGSVGAGDLMAELAADPEWCSKRDARDREQAERAMHLRVEEAPLIDDLRKVGIGVLSVWDLVNTPTPYPKALPLLLFHLARPYSDPVLEGIIRALAVKDAREIAWDTFINLIRSPTERFGRDLHELLFLPIAAMARPEDVSTLIELISDSQLGPGRIWLVRVLGRHKRPEARDTLLRLRDDADLKREIATRLKL